jgi:hypothetical protein
METRLAEVIRFDRGDRDFHDFWLRKPLILFVRGGKQAAKTAVVPTMGIFLAGDL